MDDSFDVETFVTEQTKKIKEALGDKRALIATSGGVDSTTCAALTYRAVGDNLICVLIDDNFRRVNEVDSTLQMVSSMGLPVKLEDARQTFMESLMDLEDAEDKRKAFRETFYRTLSKVAREEGCEHLVQGTIAADLIETRGGIKTQHNILEQIGINPVERYGFRVIEPLVKLFKYQVREVARYLDVPVAEKQPFPGPGLSIRVVGRVYPRKLDVLKGATVIAEEGLAEERADQYFAAIFEDETVDAPAVPRIAASASELTGVSLDEVEVQTLKSPATGVREKERAYGRIALLDLGMSEEARRMTVPELVAIGERLIVENPDYTRLLVKVKGTAVEQGGFLVALRAIKTKDFLTASVAPVPWGLLTSVADRILRECDGVSRVYYDVTPKPPATVEFE